jgi:hypothetical protein
MAHVVAEHLPSHPLWLPARIAPLQIKRWTWKHKQRHMLQRLPLDILGVWRIRADPAGQRYRRAALTLGNRA